MNMYASIALCFIPLITVFICFTLLIKDFKITHGLFSCLMGIVAVIPIAAIQFFIESQSFISVNSLGMLMVQALIVNGLIEETIKMLCLFALPAKKMDVSVFFVNSMLCGLALGCFESLVYLVSGYENIGLRMVTAVIIHVFCTSLSSLFVYALRTNGEKKFIPFVYAVVLHGVYNYFAGFTTSIKYFSIAVILFAIIEARVQYKSFLAPKNEVNI